MANGQVSFFSGDPAANPLLDIGLRPGLFGAWLTVLGLVLVGALCYASFTDLWRGRLTPNWVTHGLMAFGVLAGPLMFDDWITHLAIGAGLALLFGLLWLAGGVGMGDVKLFVGLGLVFGPAGVLIIALSQILSVIVGLPVALITGRGRKMPVPMFPFASLAVLFVMQGLGTSARLVGAGIGALALTCLYGLIERRRRPVLTLEQVAAPLIEGRTAGLRLRPYERPIFAAADGGWLDPDAEGAPADPGPRVRRRDLAVLSNALLSTAEITALDRVGEIETMAEVAGRRLRLRVLEGLSGYTLDLRVETSAD